MIVCIVTAFHLQNASQTTICFTEFVSGTLRKCMFFTDNKDLISALREKCNSGLLTELPAALLYFQKSQNWGRERGWISCQRLQRDEKSQNNNGSKSDIQTTTLPFSFFLDKTYKHLCIQKWVLQLWIRRQNCPGNQTSTFWVWETDPAKVIALRKTKESLEKEAGYHVKNQEWSLWLPLTFLIVLLQYGQAEWVICGKLFGQLI